MQSMLLNTWLVIIPAVIVLGTAIITRKVILSLIMGILSASLIAVNFSPIKAVGLITKRLLDQTHLKNIFLQNQSPTHLYTFGFLICLGIIISLITITGGVSAYSKLIEPKLKNKKNVETTSLILSSMLFLDDYLNSLIVGCVIRPLTDKFKIPRAKLAFLLDALSAPLCVLFPASSWTALILTELKTSGISSEVTSSTLLISDVFKAYLNSILFMFYPIILIANVWLIVRRQLSFGPMKDQEEIAEKSGNLFNNKEPIEVKLESCKSTGSIWDFIIPIFSFLSFTIIFLLYLGNWSIYSPIKTFFNAILNTNPLLALFMASLLSLIISILYLTLNKKISSNELVQAIQGGFNLMKNSLIVLLLAWTLGSILEQDLQTGQYLANLLIQTIPALLLPAMIFISSIIISASTGSAWGTIAIMMPLSIPATVTFTNLPIPILIDQAPLIYPVIGALISGAIAGGHISPISDSTVMAATSAGSYHIDHLITQLAYVIPAIISSMLSLTITGIITKHYHIDKNLIALISLVSGIIFSSLIIILSSKIRYKKR